MTPFLEEMEQFNLIKYSYGERSYGQSTRQTIAITRKGRRLLELLDAQAAMIPDVRWSLENTQI
jgi:DNA-binding PadR family transcriptional regulator